MRRIITPVTWLAALEWLTFDEACHLSGFDDATMREVISEGGVELNDAGRIVQAGKEPS